MNKGAEFSQCERYRYALWRIWDKKGPFVLFLMLNPSTADAVKDDPTISKCQAYARAWGYGGVYIGNIYGYRSTDPKMLEFVDDPVGPDNDKWLSVMSGMCDLRVAGWGNNILSQKRAESVRRIVQDLKCLEKSKSGNPKHPLYLRKNLKPHDF